MAAKKQVIDMDEVVKKMGKHIVKERKKLKKAPKKYAPGEHVEDVVNDRHLED